MPGDQPQLEIVPPAWSVVQPPPPPPPRREAQEPLGVEVVQDSEDSEDSGESEEGARLRGREEREPQEDEGADEDEEEAKGCAWKDEDVEAVVAKKFLSGFKTKRLEVQAKWRAKPEQEEKQIPMAEKKFVKVSVEVSFKVSYATN